MAILGYAALQLVPPYLTRQAIDVAIPAADLGGLRVIAALYFATLLGEFVARVRPDDDCSR